MITTSAIRVGLSSPQLLAPGLAALSNKQLADLLPKQRNFPAKWTVENTIEHEEDFGYYKPDWSGGGLSFAPTECFAVTVLGTATGTFHAAEVSGRDPADRTADSDHNDIRVEVGREFNPAGFDQMIGLVSHCLRFTLNPLFSYTVRILEDSRPAGQPQRFRYSLTTSVRQKPASTIDTDYFSYARVSGLILSGSGSTDHQQAFDAIFEDTLRRIRAR